MDEALKYRIIEASSIIRRMEEKMKELETVKANDAALEEHFFRQLLRMEDKIKEFEARLNDLHSDILWLKEKLKKQREG